MDRFSVETTVFYPKTNPVGKIIGAFRADVGRDSIVFISSSSAASSTEKSLPRRHARCAAPLDCSSLGPLLCRRAHLALCRSVRVRHSPPHCRSRQYHVNTRCERLSRRESLHPLRAWAGHSPRLHDASAPVTLRLVCACHAFSSVTSLPSIVLTRRVAPPNGLGAGAPRCIGPTVAVFMHPCNMNCALWGLGAALRSVGQLEQLRVDSTAHIMF